MRNTIGIVDGHALRRSGLRAMLGAFPGLDVVGEAHDGPSAVALVQELRPDILILEAGLPRLGGVEATLRVRKESSGTQVVVFADTQNTHLAVRVLRAGAAAYLSPHADFATLEQAIETVLSGRLFISPDVSADVIRRLAAGKENGLLSTLTAREWDVFHPLVEGKTNREIAAMLHISEKTVESHRLRLLSKLGARNIVELTHIAIREGLIRA